MKNIYKHQCYLRHAITEIDIESAYRSIFNELISDVQITSPHQTDGVAVSENYSLNMLMEFKQDYKLNSASGRSNILVQCLYY